MLSSSILCKGYANELGLQFFVYATNVLGSSPKERGIVTTHTS